MKSRLLTTTILVLVVIGLLSVSSPSYAQGALNKLGRGIVNTLTGWLEIPKGIVDESKANNVFTGLTVGTIKGLGLGLVRTGAGIYEALTFPFPIPEGYEPIVKPEFVYSGEK
ncbi:MAG: exosortase system-associated protein, TIGR04073 family [Candidatus Omnitrophica bacterium]|nr:exosortase system-associated protein, TIGR04073 family [Candidatus Omnitrophota bacterium]MDD5546602.1 exosortase system-associated protein, TIGR04073 family [Candidatus Omnitrophota bacterium]